MLSLPLFTLPFFGMLPIRGTDVAGKWDNLYIFLVFMSLFFFVIVIGAMVYFAVAYRKERRAKAEYIEGHHLLELVWTVIPTILVMIIFVWGYLVYKQMSEAPPDAYEIRVIAKQWSWQFQYDTGRSETNTLYVPVNKPVKLVMTSEDVIHSFFVPNFRVKKDVVPGMYTQVWFEATIPGDNHLFCAEYCGTGHSAMIGHVIALEPADWQQYLRHPDEFVKTHAGQLAVAGTAAMPVVSLVDRGRELSKAKGCVACHSTTGASGVGPTYKGLYGTEVELSDGSKVLADDNYLRESIEDPQAKIVKGYNPVMPTFKGLVNEEEMNALIAYIKSLK